MPRPKRHEPPGPAVPLPSRARRKRGASAPGRGSSSTGAGRPGTGRGSSSTGRGSSSTARRSSGYRARAPQHRAQVVWVPRAGDSAPRTSASAPRTGDSAPRTGRLSTARGRLSTAHERLSTAHERLSTARGRLSTARRRLSTAHERLSTAHERLTTARGSSPHRSSTMSGPLAGSVPPLVDDVRAARGRRPIAHGRAHDEGSSRPLGQRRTQLIFRPIHEPGIRVRSGGSRPSMSPIASAASSQTLHQPGHTASSRASFLCAGMPACASWLRGQKRTRSGRRGSDPGVRVAPFGWQDGGAVHHADRRSRDPPQPVHESPGPRLDREPGRQSSRPRLRRA